MIDDGVFLDEEYVSPDGRRWGYCQPTYEGDAEQALRIQQLAVDAGAPYARLYMNPTTGEYFVDVYDDPLD